jgi:hypothetical protein
MKIELSPVKVGDVLSEEELAILLNHIVVTRGAPVLASATFAALATEERHIEFLDSFTGNLPPETIARGIDGSPSFNRDVAECLARLSRGDQTLAPTIPPHLGDVARFNCLDWALVGDGSRDDAESSVANWQGWRLPTVAELRDYNRAWNRGDELIGFDVGEVPEAWFAGNRITSDMGELAGTVSFESTGGEITYRPVATPRGIILVREAK